MSECQSLQDSIFFATASIIFMLFIVGNFVLREIYNLRQEFKQEINALKKHDNEPPEVKI